MKLFDKLFNRNKDTLKCKLLKKLRKEAKNEIKVWRTQRTYPHYGVFKNDHQHTYQFTPGMKLHDINFHDYKNDKKLVEQILRRYRNKYILNRLAWYAEHFYN